MALDRSMAPASFPVSDFTLAKPQQFRLANGVVAHLLRAGVQPVISVQLVFKAGAWYAADRVLSQLTARMLSEGTSQKTASQIMEQVDGYGAFLEINAGMDMAEIEIYCLSKYLPPMLSLVCEILTDASFPVDRFENIRDITLQNLLINQEKTSYVASSAFRAHLFGEHHPYGSSINEAELKACHVEALSRFYQSHYKQQPFELLVAGAFSDADVQLIADTLGQLPVEGTAVLTPIYPLSHFATTAPVYIEKEGAVQTSIRIGKRIPRDIIFPATHDTQYLPVVLFNEILGGYFGSRLMKNIREEKGLTYGIHSSINLHRHECLFTISTDVKKELRDIACEEMMKELNALISTPVSKEELSLVKNYLTGSFIGSLTTSFAIAEKYRKIYFHEFPEDYFDTYVSRINQVTAEAIQEAGATFFKESELLTLMVG